MSRKGCKNRNKILAKLVTENKSPCAFCHREVDDEIIYGKLYAIGDIQCHYFCVLLSCCLIQKGSDTDGLFGFLYSDILAEIERCKKHRCSYCGKLGANMGCSISQCRKQFHLPCGRERNAVSLFYGNYKTFCVNHRPKQKVTDNVMAKVRLRMKASKSKTAPPVEERVETVPGDDLVSETVCVICYEDVQCYPTPQTFWPPCCARDAWFHRSCVQQMALSAGMHYIKCPLCNDKDNFYQTVLEQGFYVPDRDAAWELEQNAFSDIYEREISCSVAVCVCENGRDFDTDGGPWDIKLCLLCGSLGAHPQCLIESGCTRTRFVCTTCTPAAPEDLDGLATCIERIIASEQSRSSSRRVPVMPSRMSLRRTKQRQLYQHRPTGNSSGMSQPDQKSQESTNITTSRQELNLKTPTKQVKKETVLQGIENKMFSPMKLIEKGLMEKANKLGVSNLENIYIEPSVVEKVRQNFKKPKPLSAKMKMINNILDEILTDMNKPKVKEPIKAWISPKKEIEEFYGFPKQNMEIVSLEESADDDDDVIQINLLTPERAAVLEDTKIEPEPEDIKIKSDNNRNNTENINNLIETNQVSIDPDVHAIDIYEQVIVLDDDSNSPSKPHVEIVSENIDDVIPIFDTPKKQKTVEIEKNSSMEISEKDDIVNIDLVKIEKYTEESAEKPETFQEFQEECSLKTEKCIKFSPTNKEKQEKKDLFIDVESFKNQYLNEVNRVSNITNELGEDKIEPVPGTRKRKLKAKNKRAKKRKMAKIVLKYNTEDGKSVQRVKKKRGKTKLSVQNDSMQVKISLKKKRFRLKIMQSKKEDSNRTLKQYVIKCPNESDNIISKPEKDISPIKKKSAKQVRSPDNLKQTSIKNFFCLKNE